VSAGADRPGAPRQESPGRVPHRFPRFDDVESERLHRKQRLAAAFRIFAHHGFDEGLAGHITVRDPEHPECFWVNPLGMGFDRIRVKDLLLVDPDGTVLEGDWPLNRAAFSIHSSIHAARPDVIAAAHAHSPHGKAWSTQRRLLDPLTQDACAFHGDHTLYADYGGAALEVDEGERIAEALGGAKAVILANHGLLTVGTTSVDEAAWWFLAFDRACRVQLLAEAAAGPTHPIPEDMAALAATQTGPPMVGWWSFQPLFDSVVASEPDLLEE